MRGDNNPYVKRNDDPSGPKWTFNWNILRDEPREGLGTDE